MNRFRNIVFTGILLVGNLCSAAVVEKLRCEYLADPLGLDVTSPRLSWAISSDKRGEKQTAYQVLVASSEKQLAADKGDLWDSGKVSSDESSQIVYAGGKLSSREGCFWKVRVWDASGKSGPWSAVGQWHMGLLETSDWTAKWITAETPPAPLAGDLVIKRAVYEAVENSGEADVTAALARHVKANRLNVTVNNRTLGADPAQNISKRLRVDYELGGKAFTREISENERLVIPDEFAGVRYIRKSFALKAPVLRAVLYASALGLYEVRLNGQRVGDHVLAPDWTDYRKRVRYQAYDVTTLLKQGDNAVGALLANGWFSGRIGNGANQFFGKVPALLTQLEVTYADGST